MAKAPEAPALETEPPAHICTGCASFAGGQCPLFLLATGNDPDNPITACTHVTPLTPVDPAITKPEQPASAEESA